MSDLPEIVAPSGVGRSFVGHRTVSMTDVTPDGRMRFDGIARFLGDVANDDTDEAGFAELGQAWVARRTTMIVYSFPQSREQLAMTTWCAGYGKRWAERRTTMKGDAGAHVEAAALWVHLDPETGRPAPWGEHFARTYLESAAGRTVTTRLALPKAPPEHGDQNEMPWSFRRTDLDAFDHVNNAAYLAVLEEALGGNAPPTPIRVDVEWRRPTVANVSLNVIETLGPEGMTMWISDGDGAIAVIAGRPLPAPTEELD